MLKVKFILGDVTLKAEIEPAVLEGDSMDVEFPECLIRFEKQNGDWMATNGVNGHGTNIREFVTGKKLAIGECDPDLLANCDKMDQEKGLAEAALQKSMQLVNDYNVRWAALHLLSVRTVENPPSDMDFKILDLYEHYLTTQKTT